MTLDAVGEPAMGEPGRKRSRWTAIVVVVVIAVVAAGLGTWFIASRPDGVERLDVVRLDKQRVIVDSSMNLYDPLMQQFSARYSSVFSEDATEQEKAQVLNQEGEQLKRDSRTNMDRLELMGSSPALKEGEIGDAYSEFKDHYGAVISFNDQLLINSASITRSVGGPCSPLHSKMNIASESYPEDYVKAADVCLAALEAAKDGADAETTTLLTDVQDVIRGQRDKQQEALDGKDDFERAGKRMIAGLAILDINDALLKAQTKYEGTVNDKYTQLVGEANDSNSKFQKVLQKSLDQFDAEAKGGE